MVVFVDEEIDLLASPTGHCVNMVYHLSCRLLLLEFFECFRRQKVSIAMAEIIDTRIAVAVHALLIALYSSRYKREVEIKHQILVVRGGGMAAYPQVAKEALEEVGLANVVILPKHVHQQRLAKATRAYEEEIMVTGFNLWNEAGLVDIVAIVEANILPVLHTVGDALRRLRIHSHSFIVLAI